MDADQSQQFTPTVVSTDTFHIENTILRGRVAELESEIGELSSKVAGLKARILVHDENNAQLNQQVQARNKRIDVLEGTLSQLTERNGNLADSVEHHKKALAAVRLRLESVSKAGGPSLNAGPYGIEDVIAILSKCVEAHRSTGGNVFVRFSSNGSVCVQAAAVPEDSCPNESPAEAIAHLDRLIAMGREPCVSVPVPLEYLKRLAAGQSIPYLYLNQFEANCAAALLEATGNQQESGQ